jgi:hypothetical protein
MTQIQLIAEVEMDGWLRHRTLGQHLDDDDDDDDDRVAGSVKVLCCKREAGGAWLEYSSTPGPYGVCALVERFGRSELSTTMQEVPRASKLLGFVADMDAHKAKPTASFSRATTKNLVISSELAVRFIRQRGVEDSIICAFLEKVDTALSSSGATAL